ncbi:MAG: adenine phosphoribosyltransferase [Nesterenkonia sp.]|uniref:adenine phosphoribosyltransferase n=1 Tax=Nesterenkonia marinintestina TaxID=2979865 RepID=UPI0021C1DCF2|nr:adenine phosphoribosyltransferase [Nesterenkonia sp. GX14115]MDO5492806.1 adenine phosphoribosyltransferase [Nesterenkonia sp.]
MLSDDLNRAEAQIARYPDHPEPGVLFRDISPLLADGTSLRAVTDAMYQPFAGEFDIVAGVEARGFLLAGTIAALAGTGVLPIRKAGKLPEPAASIEYTLEYGSARIEAPGVLYPGTRVLVVDDVLATGGTLTASQRLVRELGGELVGATVVLELEGLGGRDAVGDHVHSVFTAATA